MNENEADLDLIIHAPVRLRVMAALCALAPGALVEFTRLKALSGATDGNLGSHLATLERAGYIEAIKDFNGKTPRTRIVATAAGRRAYAIHVAALKAIVEGAGTLSS